MEHSVARCITQLTRTDIVRLLRKGRRIYQSPKLDVRVHPSQYTVGRILIIIPKRVGNAPQRNTIRRRLKSLFYQKQLYTYGYDWAWFIKPAGGSISYHELQHIAVDMCLPQLETAQQD